MPKAPKYGIEDKMLILNAGLLCRQYSTIICRGFTATFRLG